MRLAVLCGGTLTVLAGWPVLAQDPARLDDFALPATAQPLPVEQLTTGDTLRTPPQQADRTLAAPTPSEPGGAMPAHMPASKD